MACPASTMWKLLGLFSFDLAGKTAYIYSLVVAVRAVRRRAPHRQFAVRPDPARHPRGRQAHAGDRVAGAAAAVAVFTSSAAIAGVAGALLAQTTQFVGLDVLGFPRSADLMIMLVLGRHRPALRRTGRRGACS